MTFETSDTKYTNLDKTLSAIGKAVFVKFYYEFKDTTIPNEQLIEKILRENPTSHSPRQGFRIPRAHHVFETGQELDALELIIKCDRVDPNAKEKAKEILARERKLKNFEDDIKEEKVFIDSLDREIVYSVPDEFEYENVPKPAKGCESVSGKRAKRDRNVAKNALKKAGYLCEIDCEHKLFKRKNSEINYTEPHHLVPLYATEDFPDVDLDREQNVVSLCSHCHNLLHYGADMENALRILYEKRKDLLKGIGIDITFEELKKYYE